MSPKPKESSDKINMKKSLEQFIKHNELTHALVLVSNSHIEEIFTFKDEKRAREQWQAFLEKHVSK